MTTGTARDQARLRQLNEQYIESVVKADLTWYEEHLADDFICIDAEGATFDKPAFLLRAPRVQVSDYRLEDVSVRLYGDAAVIQAAGFFTRKDGSSGACRYTDVYARSGDDWKCVSAQITRAQIQAQAAG